MYEFMKNEHEVLQNFARFMPYIPHFFDDDVSVGLTNKEIFLINQAPPSLPIKGGYGDKIPKGGLSQALETNTPVVREMPESVYGVPFRSYCVPLDDENGNVVGAVSIGRNLKRSNEMRALAQNLSQYLSQSNDAIQELAGDVQQLAVTNEDIAEKSKKASKDTEGSAQIVKMIQNISLQTNLLGINAAIEAANSGAAGRGFRVVAEEIQRLSKSATDSVAKIEGVLKEMTTSVDFIATKIVSSNELFQNQAVVLQDIAKSLENLNKIADQVKEMADKF